MDRWLRAGSRAGAGGREREGDPGDGRAATGSRRSPLRSSRDQGQILGTGQSGSVEDRAFELGTKDTTSYNQENMKRASFRASGLPMKVLNENEMSKGEDRRSKSPSVIARLMGLDSLHAKPFTDKRKNVPEKSVVEAPKASKINRPRDLPIEKGPSKQKLYDGEVKFATQNLTHENNLSVDEYSHRSRETGNASNAFDSNKDFILRLLRGRNPFSSKQLGDQNSHPSNAKPAHITILRPSRGGKIKGESSNSGIQEKVGNGIHSANLLKGPTSSVVGNYATEPLLPEQKMRKLKVIRKHEPCIHPAHIVVLKPTLNHLQASEKLLSRYRYVDNNGIQKENSASGIDAMFTQVDNPQKFRDDISPWNIPSEICRGIAIKDDKLPVENGENCYNDLSCFHQSDAAQSENGLYYIHDLNTRQPLVPHSSKASTSRQAKNHTSEQWMTSRQCQEEGLVGEGANTLGNMLASPFLEATDRNYLGTETHWRNVFPGARSKDGDMRHLRSQSTDGATVHTDSCLRKLPRRRSLSIPSSANDSISLQISYINGEKYVHRMRTEYQRSPGVPIISDRLLEKFDSKREMTGLSVSSISVASAGQLQTGTSPENKSVDAKAYTGVVNSVKILQDNSQIHDFIARENASMSITATAEPAHVIDHKHTCSIAPKEAPIQCLPNLSRLNSNSRKPHLVIKLEDPENTSPVSVLEIAEDKEPISPDCYFSGLHADLNDLRLQLDRLKLETPKSRVEAPKLVCDESNLEDDSLLLREGDGLQFCTDEEERDFSYLLGILTDSHLGGVTMDMIFNACYCLECPVDPNVFEKLEKVFDEPEVWSRADRKLLFDLVNSILSEELAPNIDLHPWVQPCRIAGLVKRRKLVAEDVWKSLVRKRKELEVRPTKPILDLSWLDARDDIDMIGRDIEKMLRDELLDEMVSDLIAV